MRTVEYSELKEVRVCDQSRLNLAIRKMSGSSATAPATIEGKGLFARYTAAGVLYLQTKPPEQDQDWDTLEFVTRQPNGDGPRRTAECHISLAADHPALGAVYISGEDMKIALADLAIGRLAVDRAITHASRGNGSGSVSTVRLSDSTVEDFSAHLLGGTIEIARVDFAEPALVIGHSADYIIRGVTGAGIAMTQLPVGQCAEACDAIKL